MSVRPAAQEPVVAQQRLDGLRKIGAGGRLEVGVLREEALDLLLVLLAEHRAGTVDETAAWLHPSRGLREQGRLQLDEAG